jgi:hypothetical protein
MDLADAVENADPFANWCDALGSRSTGVVPHLSKAVKLAKSNASSAALLWLIETQKAALREHPVELGIRHTEVGRETGVTGVVRAAAAVGQGWY